MSSENKNKKVDFMSTNRLDKRGGGGGDASYRNKDTEDENDYAETFAPDSGTATTASNDDSSNNGISGSTTNTANATNDDYNVSTKSINTPAIIGIAVVLGLACVGFALMCLYRRKRKRVIKSKGSKRNVQPSYGDLLEAPFVSGEWKAQVPKESFRQVQEKGETPPPSPPPKQPQNHQQQQQPRFPYSPRMYRNSRLSGNNSSNNNYTSFSDDVSVKSQPQPQPQPQPQSVPQPQPQQSHSLLQPSLQSTTMSQRHILRPSVITREFQVPWSLPSPTKSEPTGSGRPSSTLWSTLAAETTTVSAPPTPTASTKKRRTGSSKAGSTLPSTSSWLYRPPAVRIRNDQDRPQTLSRINTFGRKDSPTRQTNEEPASPSSRLHQEPPTSTPMPAPLPTLLPTLLPTPATAAATAANVVERMRGRRLINDVKGRLSAIPPHINARLAQSTYSSSDRESSYDASSLIDYYETAERRSSNRVSTN